MYNVFRYIINTSFRDFMKDCRSYIGLVKDYKQSKRKCSASRSNITSAKKLNDENESCIRTTWYIPSVVGNHGPTPSFVESFCSNFKLEESHTLCDNKNCPYFDKYKEYEKAMNEYMLFLRKKSTFWQEKLNNKYK